MSKKSLSPLAKNALLLGTMCSIAYLAVYVARNALSAASPQILQDGVFTTAQIGNMSSIYFITYAIGQLINGVIGDKVKGKYMISFGLMLAAIGNLAGESRVISGWICRPSTSPMAGRASLVKVLKIITKMMPGRMEGIKSITLKKPWKEKRLYK